MWSSCPGASWHLGVMLAPFHGPCQMPLRPESTYCSDDQGNGVGPGAVLCQEAGDPASSQAEGALMVHRLEGARWWELGVCTLSRVLAWQSPSCVSGPWSLLPAGPRPGLRMECWPGSRSRWTGPTVGPQGGTCDLGGTGSQWVLGRGRGEEGGNPVSTHDTQSRKGHVRVIAGEGEHTFREDEIGRGLPQPMDARAHMFRPFPLLDGPQAEAGAHPSFSGHGQ